MDSTLGQAIARSSIEFVRRAIDEGQFAPHVVIPAWLTDKSALDTVESAWAEALGTLLAIGPTPAQVIRHGIDFMSTPPSYLRAKYARLHGDLVGIDPTFRDALDAVADDWSAAIGGWLRPAGKLVVTVFDFLDSRGGFEDWWDRIGSDVRDEIKRAMITRLESLD